MHQISIINKEYHDKINELKLKFPSCNFVLGDENYTDSTIIWGNIDPIKLKHHNKLRWMQTVSAGVDRYLDGCFPKDATLTNSTGGYGFAIAEYMLAVHFSLFKKLHLYRDKQHSHEWKSCGMVRSIASSTVLVIGLGDIGGKYAKRVKALGAYVIGVRRADTKMPEFVDELHLSDKLDELLPRVDVVAIALPGTGKTEKIIDARRISLMRDGAIIINVGRGNILDTEAVCDALISGKLSGIALDVTDPEPLPENHRIWDIPSAIITPHVSGGFSMKETVDEIYNLFTANLENYLNDQELNNIIDFEEGYRKVKA